MWWEFRERIAKKVYWLLSPERYKHAEIRPNHGAEIDAEGRCNDTDEVVGLGLLHVEQMSDTCYWARLYVPFGNDVVMWFNSDRPISLVAETD